MLTCLSSSSYSYVTANLANCLNGNVNQFGITTIGNWIQAGFTKPATGRPVGLYGYFVPCFCCPNAPESYVKPMFDAIASKIVIGFNQQVLTYLFIGVARCGQSCPNAKSVVSALTNVINTAESLRTQYRQQIYLHIGIFTNKDDWIAMTGNSDAFNQYILWVADNEMLLRPKANCSDWSTNSFGGWSAPSFKQYVQGVSTCNNNFDLTICCDCQG